MSEVTKLYKNAGVLKECLSPCYINKTWRKTHDCPNCDNRENYPPFTAEKQLSLIKLLSKYLIHIDSDNGKYEVYILSIGNLQYDYYDTFEETLAYCINNLWQDLTEEERKQIKEILE